ncbi:hypothetical protein G6F42_027596 [Rhizopus arrhizus]|nr:hypothetical protein G6F42_027596 [Rhizopus arrhizus]
MLTGSSSILPLDESNLSSQSTANGKDSRIGKPLEESSTPPAPKQNILLGFGGFLSKLPQIQHNFGPEPLAYTRLRERRREAVKKSFLHGWKGYTTYAFGHDELKPLSNKPKDPFGGWGATMIDALSTLAR